MTLSQEAEAQRLKKELSEAEQTRIARYNELKNLPQFLMLDKVLMTDGFYKGQKGVIYAEADMVRNPSQDATDLYVDGICTSYKVAIQDKEEKTIDIREVYTKDISFI